MAHYYFVLFGRKCYINAAWLTVIIWPLSVSAASWVMLLVCHTAVRAKYQPIISSCAVFAAFSYHLSIIHTWSWTINRDLISEKTSPDTPWASSSCGTDAWRIILTVLQLQKVTCKYYTSMTKHKVADEPEKHYTSIQQSAGEPFTHRHLQHCLWCGLPLRDVTSDQTHTHAHTQCQEAQTGHTQTDTPYLTLSCWICWVVELERKQRERESTLFCMKT